MELQNCGAAIQPLSIEGDEDCILRESMGKLGCIPNSPCDLELGKKTVNGILAFFINGALFRQWALFPLFVCRLRLLLHPGNAVELRDRLGRQFDPRRLEVLVQMLYGGGSGYEQNVR